MTYRSISASLLCVAFFCGLTVSPLAASAEPSKEFIAQHAIELSNDFSVPAPLLAELSKYRVIAVGEVHGNAESPQFVARLATQIAAHNDVILAVEMTGKNQAAIDAFRESGDFALLRAAPHFQTSFKDGRSSIAMADLLAAVRTNKAISVLAFDPASAKSGEARDAGMAQNILMAISQRPDATVVMLAGNLHTRLKAGWSANPNYSWAVREMLVHPGSPLKESDILNIAIRYAQGSSWNCSPDCGVHTFDGQPIYGRVAFARYFLREPEMTTDGYLSAVFLRTVTASRPLVE